MSKLIKKGPRGYEMLQASDSLYSNRIVFLEGDINAENASEVVHDLWALDAESNEPIWLVIKSNGGSVMDGLTIYDTVKTMSSPVNTLVHYAYSMGAIVALAAAPENRYITEHGKYMLHDSSYGNADFSHMKPCELEEKTNDLLETTLILRKIVSEATGKSMEEVKEIMEKDSFFDSNKSIEFGLCTKKLTNLSLLLKKGV